MSRFPWRNFAVAVLALAPYAAPPALAVALQTGPTESTLGFYALAAQIIPVLLLVLAVEARVARLTSVPVLFRRRYARMNEAEPPFGFLTSPEFLGVAKVVYGAALVLILAAGEIAALHPVLVDNATRGNPRFVMSTMVAGLVAIPVLALLGWGVPDAQDEQPAER